MNRWDERRELRRARYLARFLSWKLGRAVESPRGNDDGAGEHWNHMPLRWADNGEPVTTRRTAGGSDCTTSRC